MIPVFLCFVTLMMAQTADPQAAAPTSDEPLAYADFSWVPGNGGPAERPLTFGPVVGEVRVDTAYHYLFANPQDDTISGSSEAFRHGELQLTHLGVGGNFSHRKAHARIMTQFGLYSQTTPRNDASPARGQWQLADAYRLLSEAYAGYTFDALHGINLQAGLFMSFVGLWSYYNADNWTYQPSYVSSSTPWFFNGLRLQMFITKKLKIEPWLVNGWQSYGRFNQAPGVGLQVMWRPNESLSMVGNHYVGFDTPGLKGRVRMHADESVMAKYLQRARGPVRKAAVSLTVDLGCESGDGVGCGNQWFAGAMAYHRMWFAQEKFAWTVGGGVVANPGRYLTLLPPVNGATAASGTSYFTTAPKDPFRAWDAQMSFDVIPTPFVVLRLEYVVRGANVPYFSGHKGLTPPGGSQGLPGSMVPQWAPDLVGLENRVSVALMLRT